MERRLVLASKNTLVSLKEKVDIDFIESPIQTIPEELIISIFAYLPLMDWLAVALVCKDWHRIISPKLNEAQQYTQERRHQLAILGDSDLWKYLHAMKSGGNISAYLVKLLSPHQINEQPPFINTLYGLIAYFWALVPAYRQEQYSAFSCELAKSETVFIKQVQYILKIVGQYNKTPKSHASLEDFLSFPLEYNEKQNEVFLAYKKMEDQLLAMSMLIQLNISKLNYKQYRTRDNFQKYTKILLNPKINRWLHGNDLVLLNEIGLTDLYNEIQGSVLWYSLTEDERKNHPQEYHAMHAILDALLRLIQAKDWLAYIFPEEEDDDYSFSNIHARIINQAIRINHPIILENLTEPILRRIVNTGDLYEISFELRQNYLIEVRNNIVLNILQSPIVLGHLSDACVIEFAKRLENNFSELLNAPAFLAKLDIMEKVQGKKARSQFLATLTKANIECGFAVEIAQNINIVNMIEDEDIKEISKLDERADNILKERLDQPKTDTPIPTVNWKNGLKIGGLVLISFIGIGLIAAGGVGAVVGIPLLIQVLFIAIGGTCFLASAGGWIDHLFKRKNATHITVSCNNSSVPLQLFSSQAKMRHVFNTNTPLPHVNNNIIAIPHGTSVSEIPLSSRTIRGQDLALPTQEIPAVAYNDSPRVRV